MLAHDLRLGLRALGRSKGYAFVAIASLSLAIAVTATTAAVTNAYLIRALPYPHAERLYHLQYAPPGPWEPAGMSGLDWPALSDVVEHAIAATSETMFVTNGGPVEPSRGLRVSRGFLEGLGVSADRGRALGPGDFETDGQAVPVMISHRLWRERFGADPAAVGRMFDAEIDSRNRATAKFLVVGLLRDGFWFGTDSRDLVDVIMPLRTPARAYRLRLREGISTAIAIERINGLVRRTASDLPANWPGVTLTSARDRYVASIRPVLTAATLMSALLLAIACANLSGLTLLRSLKRQKEIGVRLALGAGRGRIMRMLVIEAGVLVAIATAGGLALAAVGLAALGPSIATQLGRPAPGGATALQVDWTVVLTVVTIGSIVTMLLPLFSLLTPRGQRIASALRNDGRTTTEGQGARRWRSIFVGAQVAGALALLIGSGLMLQSLAHMMRAQYGVRTNGLVRVSVDFPRGADSDPATLASLYDQVVERLAPFSREAIPMFMWPQFAETPKQPVRTDDVSRGANDIGVVPVSAPYFDLLGIALVEGRLFANADRVGSEPVAIISAAAARRLWPDGRAVGRRLNLAERFISGDRAGNWRTVVGVVADVRQTYDDNDEADIYVPFFQSPPPRYAWLYLATSEPSQTWAPALRQAIAAVDPRAGVRIAVPIEQEAARQWSAPLFLTSIVAGCAAFAMLFAALGIYGVTAFSVQQRQREMAIRSALGATRRRLVTMVIRECALVLTAGLAVGLVASVVVGRALSAHVFGVNWFDLPTWTIAIAALSVVGLLAAWRPAAHGASANPARAL